MEGTCTRRDVHLEGYIHGGDIYIKEQPNKETCTWRGHSHGGWYTEGHVRVPNKETYNWRGHTNGGDIHTEGHPHGGNIHGGDIQGGDMHTEGHIHGGTYTGRDTQVLGSLNNPKRFYRLPFLDKTAVRKIQPSLCFLKKKKKRLDKSIDFIKAFPAANSVYMFGMNSPPPNESNTC